MAVCFPDARMEKTLTSPVTHEMSRLSRHSSEAWRELETEQSNSEWLFQILVTRTSCWSPGTVVPTPNRNPVVPHPNFPSSGTNPFPCLAPKVRVNSQGVCETQTVTKHRRTPLCVWLDLGCKLSATATRFDPLWGLCSIESNYTLLIL